MRVAPVLDLGHERPRLVDRGRVVRPHRRPALQQRPADLDARRLAHVVGVGLERQAEHADHLPAEAAQALLQLLHDQHPLVPVDVHDGVQQLRVVLVLLGDRGQRLHVLGEAGAAVPDARVEEVRSDAAVQTHPLGHQLGVRVHPLADPRDLVDERDARGQEGVGRVLDRLGRRWVGDQQRRVQALEQRGHPHGRRLLVGTDHDPVRV